MDPSTERDGKTQEAILAKIKSKMEVTKFFAGFFTVFVALSSKDLAEAVKGPEGATQVAGVVAVLAGLVSLSLTFAAVSSFDSLLMPAGLWAKKDRHGTAHLKTEMMKIWNRLYVPAVWALYLAIIASFFVVSGSVLLLLGGTAIIGVVAGWRAYVTGNQGVFQ